MGRLEIQVEKARALEGKWAERDSGATAGPTHTIAKCTNGI